jgi:hypothetical protein
MQLQPKGRSAWHSRFSQQAAYQHVVSLAGPLSLDAQGCYESRQLSLHRLTRHAIRHHPLDLKEHAQAIELIHGVEQGGAEPAVARSVWASIQHFWLKSSPGPGPAA